MHKSNKFVIFATLFVIHFDISGKNDNDIQLPNKPSIFVTLFVFHFDISGNDNNDEHP